MHLEKKVGKMDHNLKLTVRLPTSDILAIEVIAVESTRVRDILLSIRAAENPICLSGCSERHLRFVYKGKIMDNNSSIMSHGLVSGSNIDIVIRMTENTTIPEDVEYSSFVQSVSPPDGVLNAPVTTSIEIVFTPARSGLCIYTPALIDFENLPSTEHNAGDMVSNLGSTTEAYKKGYRNPWTEYQFNNRIILLEITAKDDIHPRIWLERVRYNWQGVNNGYIGGDRYSWQRYTTSLPVDCIIYESRELDGGSTITMKPFNDLKRDQYYAICLSNGVPTVPAATMDAPLFGYIGPGMCEDALYLFKTITKEEEDAQARLAAIKEFKRKSRKTALLAKAALEK